MTTIVGPETSNTPYFILTTTFDPDDLAKASTLLLSAIKARPKLTQACLEVKFRKSMLSFRYVSILCCGMMSIFVSIQDLMKQQESTLLSHGHKFYLVVEYDEIEKDKAFISCNKNISHNKSQCGECFVSHVSSEMQDAHRLQFCGSSVYPSYSLSHNIHPSNYLPTEIDHPE